MAVSGATADTDPVVRSARPDDEDGVRAMIARIFADYGDVLDVEREDTHLQSPCDYFRAGGGAFWVADAGGRVVASAAVKIEGDAAEIKAIYVAHAYRRRGLARRMTLMAMDYARRARGPAVRIGLWSDSRFVEAHRLYESLGFIRRDVREIKITNEFCECRFELPGGFGAAAGPR